MLCLESACITPAPRISEDPNLIKIFEGMTLFYTLYE